MHKKTAIISGGTGGIGKGSVLQLLKDGFNIATFSTNKKHCDSLRKELGQQYDPKRFLVMPADVANENSLNLFIKEAIKKFKKIDVLINNAGVGYFSDCDKVDMTKFQKMISINIVGLALLTKLAVPFMKKNKSGLIINVASISGKRAFTNGEFYSATKFAVMGYSEGIRSELSAHKIKVATICPGMIKTNFFTEEELEKRKKVWKKDQIQMLEVEDIKKIISLICNQSEHCDVQDITIMPF
ncbi:MAG: SDR family NAD(P)-dependent oxidoreductase [bacterium]